MPARPISSGNISFGLVSIPVKMYPTTDHSASIRFNMLDPSDGTRVKQQYINPGTGEIVKRNQMVKGYEFSKGQYVTFTNEEIADLAQKASPSIAITEFVPMEEVEPIFYDNAYFLGPETGGERAYKLLSVAMRETERCALARYAARGKQYLVMIRPFEDGVIMQQMHYADEVRSFSEVPLGEDEIEIEEAELNLAKQLIEQIASDAFEPGKYEDEVRKRLWEAIQAKVAGKEVTIEEEAPKAKIIDLMEALKKSLADDDAGSDAKPAKKRAKAKKKSSKKASRKKKTATG